MIKEAGEVKGKILNKKEFWEQYRFIVLKHGAPKVKAEKSSLIKRMAGCLYKIPSKKRKKRYTPLNPLLIEGTLWSYPCDKRGHFNFSPLKRGVQGCV